MRTAHLAASVMAAVLVAMRVAHGAPMEVTHARTAYDDAWGGRSDAYGYEEFYGWSHNINGVGDGYMSVRHYDYDGDWMDIACYGPAYANVVSVDENTKSVTVKGTLDPADPNCWSSNVSGPVAIDIRGQADGDYSFTSRGVNTDTYFDQTYKSNYMHTSFSAAYAGTVLTGSRAYQGSASATRNGTRVRVK